MSRFLCNVLHTIAVIMTVALLSACATTAPVQEMSNARQSIQAAVEIGAEEHAPDSLAKARQLLQEASEALDSGNYLLAKQNALSARLKILLIPDIVKNAPLHFPLNIQAQKLLYRRCKRCPREQFLPKGIRFPENWEEAEWGSSTKALT